MTTSGSSLVKLKKSLEARGDSAETMRKPAKKWWNWEIDSNWTERGFETTRYLSLLVKDGKTIRDEQALEKFNRLGGILGFNVESVTRIFAISNEKLKYSFEAYHDTLYGKHRANPGIFKRTDWKLKGDLELRQKFIDELIKTEEKCFLNQDPTKPSIIPMLQGSSEEAVWQICQQGFSTVSETDDGFYGKGIYFTSDFQYANQYAKKVPAMKSGSKSAILNSGTGTGANGILDAETGENGSLKPGRKGDLKVFLVSLVIPGNAYPATENPYLENGKRNPKGLLGKACNTGYQSHFTLVNANNIADAYPIHDSQLLTNPPSKSQNGVNDVIIADGLVVFEAAQALPLFVFYAKDI